MGSCIRLLGLVFWNLIHLEVASDSFCFLWNCSWLLVFILYVFFMIFSGFNLYCWNGIHFSQNNFLIFLLHFAFIGFLLGITIFLQIITGIFLSLHYTSDLNSAYFCLFFLIREVFYGWCLRYLHSSGASFVFLFLFLHLGRAMFYGSYFYNPNTWFSGIYSLLLNGYSIYGLCLTFWTN